MKQASIGFVLGIAAILALLWLMQQPSAERPPERRCWRFGPIYEYCEPAPEPEPEPWGVVGGCEPEACQAFGIEP